MRQHTEFITKVFNLKESVSKKGYLYNFSVPLTDMVVDKEVTEWLRCTIFLKEKDKRLTDHKGEFHFSGSLKVKPAYKEYAQGVSLFGFEIEPVLGKVYRQSKPRPQTKESDFPEPSKSIPF